MQLTACSYRSCTSSYNVGQRMRKHVNCKSYYYSKKCSELHGNLGSGIRYPFTSHRTNRYLETSCKHVTPLVLLTNTSAILSSAQRHSSCSHAKQKLRHRHHIGVVSSCRPSVGCYSLVVFRRESVVLVEIRPFLAGLRVPIAGGIGGGECIEVFGQVPCLKVLHNGCRHDGCKGTC
jgi:hypothetical protein